MREALVIAFFESYNIYVSIKQGVTNTIQTKNLISMCLANTSTSYLNFFTLYNMLRFWVVNLPYYIGGVWVL